MGLPRLLKKQVDPSQFASGDKVCKNCHSTVDWSLKHCPTCGKDDFFRSYNEYLETTYKYCISCGYMNKPGYKRCPKCGGRFITYNTYLDRKEREKNKDTNKKKFNKLITIPVLIICVCVLAFAIWAYYYYDKPTWAALLQMFIVYTPIMHYIVYKNRLNILKDEDTGIAAFFMLVTSGIATVILLGIDSCRIYGWVLSLSMVVSVIDWIICTEGYGGTLILKLKNYRKWWWQIAAALILFAVATSLISAGGWSLYF